MIIVGLTGSIAMGKSTVASMFLDCGAPIYDADAAIHNAYGPGGAAVEAVRALAPEAVSDAGVDRGALKKRTIDNPAFLKDLEAAVHPIIARDRENFTAEARAQGAPYAIYDIPLLFETGGEKAVDVVLVVSAPSDVQKERALAREGMSEAMLETILARQTPDAERSGPTPTMSSTPGGLWMKRALRSRKSMRRCVNAPRACISRAGLAIWRR